MDESKITDYTKSALKELIVNSFSVIKSDLPENIRWSAESSLFFDLDKLWLMPDVFESTNKIVSRIINNQGIEIDFVGGISSNAGAFGTVPIASVLAQKLNKPLITCVEMDFGDYYITPLSQDFQEILNGKKILLMKDVLVGGNSIEKIGRIISDFGGEISGVFIFVDFKETDLSSYKGITENTVLMNPLTKRDFKDFQG